MSGKGDTPRPVDPVRYAANYDRIKWQQLKIHAIITTYNRPESYEVIARSLVDEGVQVTAWDDGSDVKYPKIPGVEMKRVAHHGRDGYGVLVSRIFAWMAVAGWDRIVMVPDDFVPAVARPMWQAERHLQEARRMDPDAALLGLHVDRRGHARQWKSHSPVFLGNVVMTGWNDLCFYADERIRPVLRGRFDPPGDHYAGSGVGAQFTSRVREIGNLWHVRNTLYDHLQGESRMCPIERGINPL